jgi:hypothetical protein
MIRRYKSLHFTQGQLVSRFGSCAWHVGVTQRVKLTPILYRYGFHCSPSILDALMYGQGNILAEVEVGGASACTVQQEAWQEMTILQAWHWQRSDSLTFALFLMHLASPFYAEVVAPRTLVHETITTLDTSIGTHGFCDQERLMRLAVALDVESHRLLTQARQFPNPWLWKATSVSLALYEIVLACLHGEDAQTLQHVLQAARDIQGLALDMPPSIEYWLERHLADLIPYEEIEMVPS